MIPPKNNAAVRQKLINKTLKILSFRPQSIAEIKLKLKKFKPSASLLNEVIDYFIELDMLNDQKFAAWWVEQRSSHRPKGNLALKSELIQKGVDQSNIDSVLLSIDQERALAKKLLKLKKFTDKQKAYQYLYSRGFSSNSINLSIDGLNL